jgi:hypothetical protein
MKNTVLKDLAVFPVLCLSISGKPRILTLAARSKAVADGLG